MLYQDSQNHQSWKDLMGQFRKDPGLMKFVLDKNDRYYCYFDLGNGKRTNTANKGKRVIASQELKNRQVKTSSGKNMQRRQIYVDWSQSEIDGLVIKGIFHFQADPDCYSCSQVEELMCSKEYDDIDVVFKKSIETLERLKKELKIPSGYMEGVPKTYESVDGLLATCLNLFKVRAIVVKILKTVHVREDFMLKLMSDDEPTAKSTYESIHKMNQELVQLIAFLHHSRFPVKRFIYLGEDLQEKILKDNDKLKTLYPILQESEEQEEEI
jgi:Zn/Cd-binding protein ZinT